MTSKGFGFLRPYLFRDVRPLPEATCRSHLRFHAVTRHCKQSQVTALNSTSSEVRQRAVALEAAGQLNYPRVDRELDSLAISKFRDHYERLKAGETDKMRVVVGGRVRSFRIAGSKLLFVDIVQDGRSIQGVINVGRLKGHRPLDYLNFHHYLQRGDIISLTGNPHRTARGELGVEVTELPKVLSRCLHSLPEQLTDSQVRIKNKHVDLLVNSQSADTLRLRSRIIQRIRRFLLKRDFMEVETPILADGAGGAIARAFKTSASEFPERKLSMRVAPELWLKRLVLGGFDRIFEIGRCFRNEGRETINRGPHEKMLTPQGLDLTHNPEFTTCEFYMAYAELHELIELTEDLIVKLGKTSARTRAHDLRSLPPLDLDQFTCPFARIEFIPALETAIERHLPDLAAPDATSSVLALFTELSIPPPTSPTLPRLLDKLSAHYLEPQCQTPTFILHAPECLSPLSKSFLDRRTGQRVSARAELFIRGREVVNTYEEENSPAEQRRKFVEQAKYRDAENEAKVDESYLEALEWGLPPTGGWGCGVDRLCMLFAGTERIADVLSFGSLRNVVALK